VGFIGVGSSKGAQGSGCRYQVEVEFLHLEEGPLFRDASVEISRIRWSTMIIPVFRRVGRAAAIG
jgi:hypothetical protein